MKDAAEQLMRQAITLCREGIRKGQSPFAAVVARRDGTIIAATHNTVRLTCDSTAHAEVNAIRAACIAAGTIDLSGHLMATTCEPCPMCASAIHWARLDTVYYGASIQDAAEAGFHELSLSCGELYRRGGSDVQLVPDVLRSECAALFAEWKRGPRAEPY